jgi:hypothetical protein
MAVVAILITAVEKQFVQVKVRGLLVQITPMIAKILAMRRRLFRKKVASLVVASIPKALVRV